MARTKLSLAEKRVSRRTAYMARRKTTVPRNVPSIRYPRSLSSDATVYPFKRSVSAVFTMNPSTGFTSGAGIGWGIGMSVTLNNLVCRVGAATLTFGIPTSTDFQNLFDQWRVAKVVFKYIYSNNVSTTAAGTTFLPTVLIHNDQDDDAPPAAETEVLQRPQHLLMQLGTNGITNNIRSMTCKPTIALAAYQGALTAFAQGSRSTFVDMAYPDTRYYGQKLWWTAERATNVDIGSLQVYADIFYEFRGVR